MVKMGPYNLTLFFYLILGWMLHFKPKFYDIPLSSQKINLQILKIDLIER